MIEIKAYKTSDGLLFEDKKVARFHEEELMIGELVESNFKEYSGADRRFIKKMFLRDMDAVLCIISNI